MLLRKIFRPSQSTVTIAVQNDFLFFQSQSLCSYVGVCVYVCMYVCMYPHLRENHASDQDQIGEDVFEPGIDLIRF